MRQRFFRNARRVIVKIGTSVLERNGDLDPKVVDRLAADIARVRAAGVKTALVSSGAIAAGMGVAGLKKRPVAVEKLQALAAIGQRRLMQIYDSAFARQNVPTAQVLLTWEDLGSRRRYDNTRRTIAEVLRLGALPVINENDTVATEEIRFGDNDQLSAMVAALFDADLLILLSDSNGFYTDVSAGASSRLAMVDDLGASIFAAAKDSRKNFSKGGMRSKLGAIQKALAAGIPCVLADGKTENVISRLFEGGDLGTIFLPRIRKSRSKQHWIRYVSKPEGAIVVDDGAREAVLKKGRSLLAKGIVRVVGRFEAGSAVELKGPDGGAIGKGIVNFSSEDIEKIRGADSREWNARLGHACLDEVLHRDNFVANAPS